LVAVISSEVPTEVDLSSVVQVGPNQVSSRVGDEAAILDLDNSVYYSLDPVGTRIFDLIQQPTALSAVLATLLDEYEVDEAIAREDLLAIVGELIDRRLVVVRASDAP
jgi:hypothetical protein